MRADEMIVLDSTADSLREGFNTANTKIRFMALLSPTCPLWRDQGARAVQENIFKKYPNAEISGSIVWIPILQKDSFESAVNSAKVLYDDRIKHFYDTNRTVGKFIADSVRWTGQVAWDIYLFYKPKKKWIEAPPKPDHWMHQLKDDWATKNRYRTGNDLMNELSASMRKLLAG